MKKSVLILVTFFPLIGLADTTYDNFFGYGGGYAPLGDPNTATYGETFMAPTNGDNVLESFSFYFINYNTPGTIDMSAYIAPWTGTMAGTPLYVSPEIHYANPGDANLSFSTGGLALTPGAEYVMFLSVSQYYDTNGLTGAAGGSSTIPGGNFVYYNNGSNFNELFTHSWDDTGSKPEWAVTANFTTAPVPEPSVFALFLTVIALVGIVARKRHGRQAGAGYCPSKP